jgi:hypothetical protein
MPRQKQITKYKSTYSLIKFPIDSTTRNVPVGQLQSIKTVGRSVCGVSCATECMFSSGRVRNICTVEWCGPVALDHAAPSAASASPF